MKTKQKPKFFTNTVIVNSKVPSLASLLRKFRAKRPGLLNKSIVYLAGPMDRVKDHGVGWRRRIIADVTELGIGINFLDPTNKPAGARCKEEQDAIANYRENGEWDKLTKYVHQYRRFDLRCVDYSDFLILYVDTDVHMCGSYDEAVTCERQKKPILAIIKGGRKKAPSWLFGIVKWQEMFESVDECVAYLVKINARKVKLDSRWVLIRQAIENHTTKGNPCPK